MNMKMNMKIKYTHAIAVAAAIMTAAMLSGCNAPPTPTVPTTSSSVPSTNEAPKAEAHATVKLTSANFGKTVRENEGVVLVDFWATWCGPCIQLAPTVEAVAAKYEGKVTVGKLDIDEEEKLASEFGIQSIPTLIVFKNGKVVEQIVGLVPQSKIEKALDKQLI
jgi:thioredoxin 1